MTEANLNNEESDAPEKSKKKPPCQTIPLTNYRRDAVVIVGGNAWLLNTNGQHSYPMMYLHPGTLIEVNANIPHDSELECGMQLRIKSDFTDLNNNGQLAEVANTLQITVLPSERAAGGEDHILNITKQAMRMAHAFIMLAIEMEACKRTSKQKDDGEQ